MATTFTSWSDLYTSMLNKLAGISGGNMLVADYTITIGGHTRRITYRSFNEFKQGLEYVKYMADLESGNAVRRTYAKQSRCRY